MANCWEEYMWKVHKAVPVDPWTTNVQLLDVFIQERSSSLWLPSWLHKKKASMSRVGSMLTLGVKADSSMQKAVNNVNGGGAINNNGAAATSSGEQLLNKNSANGGADGVPTNVTNKETPAQSQHINKTSDTSTEPVYDTLLIFKDSYSMPDIQASIRSSTSWMTSITGGSSASAQFDVKGSKTVACNVGGVKSLRVDVDALMELVTPRTSGLLALWRPDISLPQLQWHCKRGQTLWVVTEIMTASMIKIEGEMQDQANGKATVSKGVTVEGSQQLGVEKEGVWTVTAPKDNPSFPFALRLQRLNYDASGSLFLTSSTHQFLKRNNSSIKRPLSSSNHVDALPRSLSISH